MISRKQEKFIANASYEAMKSPMLFKHGCVAVCNGKQIASGYNNYRTYSKDKIINNTCSTHAEIDCVRKCIKNKKNTKHISIYIVKINKKNELKNSKPCSQCLLFLKKVNIKKIYYSDGISITKTKGDYTPYVSYGFQLCKELYFYNNY